MNCLIQLSAPSRRAPPGRHPCPYHVHRAGNRLPRQFHLLLCHCHLHIGPPEHPCRAPGASGVIALSHQLPLSVTPIICARTGSMLSARSRLMLLCSATTTMPSSSKRGVAGEEVEAVGRCFTFSPILQRSGAWKPENARRKIGSSASKTSGASSLSQRSSARQRPS